MPAIITNKFRLHNASNFVESFSESSPNIYYLAIGRPQAFATSTGGDSRTQFEGTDVSPLTPTDSVSDEFYFFDDVIAAKRITSSDVSRAVPRRNWTTCTTYDIYRHDYGQYVKGSSSTTISSNSGATSLADATFYVLSSDNNVYKVIDNNGNSASTVEPTGTSTSILTTGDSYKWKYMYTLTASEQTNFLSTDFMHVSTDSTVAAAAVDGALDTVLIKTAGSGGTNGTHTGIAIRGDGSSGVASVTVAGGAGIAADLSVGDDLRLISDSAVLSFGADSDTTLTHTDGTGLTLNSTNKLTFRDTALFVNSSTDGQLDIDADAEVEITAPIVDINASTRVDISGDLTVGDDLTLGSDGAILNFGADSDINITHVADTGLTTNGDFTVGDDLTISGGVVDVKNTGSQSVVRFYCESSNAHYTEIQAAAHSDYSGNVTVTLPVTTGTLATTASAADEATALAIALG